MQNENNLKVDSIQSKIDNNPNESKIDNDKN